jgi:fibronectin type 3 domain-containing protein
VLLLLLGAFIVVAPGSTLAAQDGDYTYVTSGSPAVATITGYTGAGGTITIPSVLGGYAVVAIGASAFKSINSLTSVTISDGVVNIEEEAFRDCNSLTSITLPDSLMQINDLSFMGTRLTSVTVPKNVTLIGDSPFATSTMTTINVDPGNPSFASVDGVLYDKNINTIVECPGSIAGSFAIPVSVTSIADYAFFQCGHLTTVTIPSGVTSLGIFSFCQMNALTSITIPNSVISIGQSAFQSCNNLTSMNFLGIVAPTSVGNNWILGTPSGIRGHAYVASNFPAPGGSYHGLVMGEVIPSSVDYTYAVNDGKATITAYTGAGGAITIPSTLGGYAVVAIGSHAFDGVAGHLVTSVIIPNSVTTIGNYAFYLCTALTSVTIPGSVISIGDGAFHQCTALTAIEVNASNANYASADGVFYNKALATLITYPGGKAGAFAIPESVTTIKNYAFFACIALTSVTIPGSVTSIGDGTFRNCKDLASVTIPGSITSIGEYAFGYCLSLPSITIPGSVISIANWAFTDCSSLTSITIPGSITNFGYYAFYQCTALTSVTLLNGVTTIPEGTFYQCTALTSVTIPGSVTSIGEYAFAYCNSLTKMLFKGNAPTLGNGWLFTDVGLALVIYYINGSTGFTTPTWNGYPTVCLFTPTTPMDLKATAGDGQVRLSWETSSSDGGTPITNYTVYRGTVSGGETALITLGNVLNYTDTGLINGIAYYFKVSAVNLAGESSLSNEASGTPVTVPSAPRSLLVVGGDMRVDLNWTAPSYVGPGTLNYHLFRDGVLLWNGTGRAFTDTAVNNDVTYEYKVAASNSIGWGPNCTAMQATPSRPPFAPMGLTAIAGDRLVKLNWTAPSYVGAGTITYHLFRDGAQIWSGTGLAKNDTVVSNGVTYSYSVAASNSIGWGPNCTAELATPVGPPSAPRGLSAIPGYGYIDLNWTDPIYAGPGTITYHLFRDGAPIYEGPATTYNDPGQSKGMNHLYKVAASNAIGWGLNCTAVASAALGVPDAPRGLTAVPGDGRVYLNWTAPAYVGPGTVTSHIFRNGTLVWSSTAQNYMDTGLINGLTYSYSVATSNDIGYGLNSTVVQVKPAAVPPSTPTNLQAAAGDAQVSLSWIAPSQSGSSTITGYKVYRGTTPGGETFLVTLGNVLTYTDSSLNNGRTYYYKVSAISSAGEGTLTESVVTTPAAPSPSGDNTMLYIGLVAVVALAGISGGLLYYRRRKQ